MLQQALRLTSVLLIVFCGCGLLLSGCETGGDEREMASVSGKVTLNDKALDAGRVIFAHVEGPGAAADIQPDGTYSVEAAVGQTAVSIDHRTKPGPEPMPGGREGLWIGESLVPEQYADAMTSGLSLDIKSGKNEFNIEMVGKVE